MTVMGPGPAATEPVACYRHADRRAGVRCQRCERPICPSCMVTAAVGFQCPECASSGPRTQRAAELWSARGTPVTIALIAVNVAVFLTESVSGTALGGRYVDLADRFGLIAVWSPPTAGAGVSEGEWWRIITSGFLHAGALHLAFNMFALYSVGRILERVVGSMRFGLIYAVSVIGGSLGALALSGQSLTVGASGGIFGLFGAFAVLEMSRGINPMQGGIGPTIGLNLFITFAVPGISIGGHLGGLVAGATSAALLIGLNRQQAIERARRGPAMIGVVVVMAAALFVGAVVVGHLVA